MAKRVGPVQLLHPGNDGIRLLKMDEGMRDPASVALKLLKGIESKGNGRFLMERFERPADLPRFVLRASLGVRAGVGNVGRDLDAVLGVKIDERHIKVLYEREHARFFVKAQIQTSVAGSRRPDDVGVVLGLQAIRLVADAKIGWR